MPSVQIPPTWTPQEQLVWERVSAGEIADFNEIEGYGGDLDPNDPKDWPENRILRLEFLETILLSEPYRSALHRQGVRIIGAWFKDTLDLSQASLDHPLWLHRCRFESDVDLSSLRTSHLISIQGSTFKGTLDMDGIQVERTLFMSEGATFAEVVLRSAKIGGQLDMTNFTFKGTLNMNGIQVKGDLFMSEGVTFAEVVLLGAKIGDQLAMTGSTFNGRLDMSGIQVEGHLLMRGGATFEEVVLRSAKIGRQLAMIGSTFKGKLVMDSIQVEGSLFMRDSEANSPIGLIFGEIGHNLDFSGATIGSLDLTGTQVGGELRLGSTQHPAAKWKEGAELILRNTQVGALQDLQEAWPDTLELDGFTYGLLGGFAADEESDMPNRDIKWLKGWLGKQRHYTPRPYEQLAGVLRKAGYKEKATAILYESKKREHGETTSKLTLTWWWLTLQWLFIGYGYRNFRVLIWVLIFLGLGMLVLHQSDIDMQRGMRYWGLAYSVDMLLPIIELHKPHYTDIILDGWVRVYFYVHKIFGYVLASFLVAGLSGLTKK